MFVGELLPTSDFVFECAFCVVFCDDFDSFRLFDVFPPCELEESDSELDEFDWSESLELPLDDDPLELEQLDSVELTDCGIFLRKYHVYEWNVEFTKEKTNNSLILPFFLMTFSLGLLNIEHSIYNLSIAISLHYNIHFHLNL